MVERWRKMEKFEVDWKKEIEGVDERSRIGVFGEIWMGKGGGRC